MECRAKHAEEESKLLKNQLEHLRKQLNEVIYLSVVTNQFQLYKAAYFMLFNAKLPPMCFITYLLSATMFIGKWRLSGIITYLI